MSDKYLVYFEQVNEQWIEVTAISKDIARRKAVKLWPKLNTPSIYDDESEPRIVERVQS